MMHVANGLFRGDGPFPGTGKPASGELPACCKNQACLNNPDFKLCPVVHCVMHKLIFIKCLEERNCAYKSVVEGAAICTCPIRKEIYNRSGK
jgi:hypothetical protein